MAFQGHKSWTPLESSDGDLGTTYPPVDLPQDDTSYHGYDGSNAKGDSSSQLSPYLDGYEMNDMGEQHSHVSSAPLLSMKDPLIQTPPSIRDSTLTKSSRFRRQFSGWKVGVIVCSTIASTVCLLNTILTIWAATKYKATGALGYLYTGSCSEVANMNLWIHLGINAMSTLLLSASNYTMQVISSPTRKEVDIAHQKGRWLDVGIPSTRNLWGISWVRVVMWSILAMSSIPLHLMYNTAIFASTTANAYDYLVVTEDFLKIDTLTNVIDESSIEYAPVDKDVLNSMHTAAMNGSLLQLDNVACMAKYANTFVSNARNVLLVTTDTNPNHSYFGASSWFPDTEIPYFWICGDSWDSMPYENHKPVCTLSKAQAGASSWSIWQHPISYCLIQPVEEECRLNFSLTIMIIVILANATKASIMILTWWKLRTPTLVTIGDAITSFLDDPDPTTAGICLATKRDIWKGKGLWKDQGAKHWIPKRHFWFRAASVKRWLTCNILCCSFIILGIILLRVGMASLGIYNLEMLWQLGFGQVNGKAVVSVAPRGLIAKILFANLPQGILSFLYLTYNGLYSCMLGAHEWSLFGIRRRAVRVTTPVGKQRSTYYLQLPYWYAVPLLILSGLLHWLMSQSLFLALVDVVDSNGELDDSNSISTVGYSCIPIFFAIIVGVVAVTAGVLNGFRRYNASIPLVGSCSAAISAACHRPSDDSSASQLPLKWGCINTDSGNNIGHCSLSSFEVTAPEDGLFYAGKQSKED